MCAQSVPEWMIPPIDGFRAEGLDRLTELPPHTELIDGSLVLASPQSVLHSLMIDLLTHELRSCAPAGFKARREISVVIDERQRPEPDLVVVRDQGADFRGAWYPADSVELAVEVVSPASQRRDRERKPQLYAGAGIPHFWRVELRDGKPVVHTYERDVATGQYALTGIFHDRLVLSVPFAIDIDLTRVEEF